MWRKPRDECPPRRGDPPPTRFQNAELPPLLAFLRDEHEFTNESYIDVGNGIKFPTGWHSHEGYDDNFNNQNISAGHNAFGGPFKNPPAASVGRHNRAIAWQG